MYISDIDSTEKERVEMEGAEGVWIQWLIARKNGAENYAMRLFTVEKGGKIPRHQHPWEHEILFLEGEGIVGAGEEERVDPIQHPAVTGQQRARVFDMERPLEQRLHEIAELSDQLRKELESGE
jgi:hypothetical protein